ncbi:MAG: hypothetical protein J6333_08085, partial [Planctomycetes bacterium]|nr:hypothetical protein [Planctomycetota bacterium]
GARAALAAAGLPGKRLTVLAAPQHAAWNDSRENAYRLALRAAELRFDGLIFSSLNGVKGAVRAFNELGLRVPGDVAYAAVGNGNGEELYMTPRPGSLVFDTRAAMEMAVAFVLSPETGVPRLRTVGATYTARDSA